MPEEKAGRNREDYRKKNRGMALRLIATGTCTNRSQLVEKLGLSKMAITKIVAEMLGKGLLREEAGHSEVPGRAPGFLAIAPEAPLVAGVAIHRGRCEAVLCDLSLGILGKEEVFYSDQMDEEKLLTSIYKILDNLLYGKEKVIAIGVASVGPVSSSAGKILKPYYFYGIHDVQIVRVLEERYHLPVFLDHDNQSAAVAEYFYGCGKDYRDILYVGVGSGLGCGIIHNGLRYRNDRGLPPELGHVSIDMNGRRCPCGSRGCVELYVRSPELLKKLYYHSKKYYSYETYARMQDNPLVQRVFQEAIMALSAAVVSTINITSSQLIILGNDAVYWDESYIRMMDELVNERRFVEWDTPVQVRRSSFMEDAVVLGAACNALDQLFQGNLLFEE